MTSIDTIAEGGDGGIRAAAAKAIELIDDGARVGLGSGNAARMFISLLGERWRQGLRVSCVPTSRDSADHAIQEALPLIALGGALDITVDGADEVAPNLDLVKGWGGAFVRERIVAAASQRQVILVTEEKLVDRLGARRRIPVEVVPIASAFATQSLESLGLTTTLRIDSGDRPFVSENGNVIIDCAPTEPLPDRDAACALEQAMLAIAGVVDTGLFLGTAELVFVGLRDGGVVTMRRPQREES